MNDQELVNSGTKHSGGVAAESPRPALDRCSFCWEGREGERCADSCHDGDCPIGATMVGWPHPRDMETCSSQGRRPAETFHVIDFIREEMDERNWSIWTLVRHMSDDQSDEALGRIKLALEFLQLRDPDMLIGEEVARGLARAFATGAEIWLNLDQTWRDAQRANTASGTT